MSTNDFATALDSYLEIAENRPLRRAAERLAEAGDKLLDAGREKVAKEKKVLLDERDAAEKAVAACDREETAPGDQLAKARRDGDEDAAHEAKLKQAEVGWRRDSARQRVAAAVAELAKFESRGTWQGTVAEFWEAWKRPDGPSFSRREVLAMLSEGGVFANLQLSDQVGLQWSNEDGRILDWAPRHRRTLPW